MKHDDPTLDRIREVRHQISAEFGHDPRRLLDYYAELEKELCSDKQVKEDGLSGVDHKRA
jgi:citrate synthase